MDDEDRRTRCGVHLMSGIVAAYGPFDPSLGEGMLSRLSHRGRDGVGHLSLAHAWLGSQYLAIADPEGGAQPLAGDPGTWLVGDGEIYNHRRIREALGPETFRTESDLEAALRLYQDRGVSSFERMWGHFVLVIASEDGGFAVARDVLGLAPLYWARRDRTVLFASELKAFPEDWQGAVEPFPPGHAWTPDGGLVPCKPFPGGAPVLLMSRGPEEEPPGWVFDAVRETLVKAVERALDSRTPVGILLSGGVDSSIITAVAARLAAQDGRRVPTFAVGLEGSADLTAARLVAEHTGTEHHELAYSPQQAIDLVPQVIAELESFDPTLVHSAVPNYLVARLAAEHVRVVLAGEGADEIFAGYSHYHRRENTGQALHRDLLDTLATMHVGGLQRVDRVAGAHGLEPRLPFLDLDVVELAMALPPAWKMVGPDKPAKWLLRRAFDGWLPDEVLWRPKQQFGEGTGMNEVLRAHFEDTVDEADLAAEQDVLDPPLRTREELAYYRMFTAALPGVDAQKTIGRFAEA